MLTLKCIGYYTQIIKYVMLGSFVAVICKHACHAHILFLASTALLTLATIGVTDALIYRKYQNIGSKSIYRIISPEEISNF